MDKESDEGKKEELDSKVMEAEVAKTSLLNL